MDNWSRTTDEMIYSMLTESTGTNMLDSGGDSDRHWQRNQVKSFEDFNNEPCLVLLDQDTDYPYYEKSTFHHLANSLIYLKKENQELIEWVEADKYNRSDNPEGRCLSSLDDICKYMSNQSHHLTGELGLETRVINTYNSECSLTQTLQFITLGDTYDSDIIALAIHNGADVRGGYTDYKIFKICEDMFYMWYEEYDEDNHYDLIANI
tara:strand:+ start:184 stop:807 length:624 start_codon:yes stop_codon:yes gene_type:complete